MANDKITMLKLKRMLQLLDAGKSMNEICRDLHMSKRTVHNYKQRVASSSVPLTELRRLDDKQLNQLLQPQSPVPKPDERKEGLDNMSYCQEHLISLPEDCSLPCRIRP